MFKINSSINIIPSEQVLDQKVEFKVVPSINEYILRFDGCSKGNPGLSGCGIVIYHNGVEIYAKSKYLGDNKTNNQAEYCALILGLKKCLKFNIKKLKVEGDSLLVINQLNKKWKINSILLMPLFITSNKLISNFDYIEFNHIYRSNNKRADSLCNLALKQQEKLNTENIINTDIDTDNDTDTDYSI